MALVQRTEERWTVALGLLLITAVALGWIGQVPVPLPWDADPRAALPLHHAIKLLALLAGVAALAALGVRSVTGPHDARFWGIDHHSLTFLSTSAAVGVVAILARVINEQSWVAVLALPDPALGLALGLCVSHARPDRGGRRSLAPQVWVHLGLTLLGAEVLMPQVLALGVPGLVVVGVVTPIVVVAVWLTGTRLLRAPAEPRLLLIAIASAVGGVGAVMATATASRARKSELAFTLAVTGLCSAALVHVLPRCARTLQLDAYVSGVWLGGTADVHDAAHAASTLASATAVKIAISVAQIQSGMLGLMALVVAVFWLTSGTAGAKQPSLRHGLSGFPGAVVGLLLASAVSSFILLPLLGRDAMQELARGTGELCAWCFTLAATALGMELRGRTLVLEAQRGISLALLGFGVLLDVVLTLVLAEQVFGRALATVPH